MFSAKLNLHSIGHASQLLQESPGEIERAMQIVGIVPRLTLNSVIYLEDGDLARVREQLHPTPADPVC